LRRHSRSTQEGLKHGIDLHPHFCIMPQLHKPRPHSKEQRRQILAFAKHHYRHRSSRSPMLSCWGQPYQKLMGRYCSPYCRPRKRLHPLESSMSVLRVGIGSSRSRLVMIEFVLIRKKRNMDRCPLAISSRSDSRGSSCSSDCASSSDRSID